MKKVALIWMGRKFLLSCLLSNDKKWLFPGFKYTHSHSPTHTCTHPHAGTLTHAHPYLRPHTHAHTQLFSSLSDVIEDLCLLYRNTTHQIYHQKQEKTIFCDSKLEFFVNLRVKVDRRFRRILSNFLGLNKSFFDKSEKRHFCRKCRISSFHGRVWTNFLSQVKMWL